MTKRFRLTAEPGTVREDDGDGDGGANEDDATEVTVSVGAPVTRRWRGRRVGGGVTIPAGSTSVTETFETDDAVTKRFRRR